MILGDIAELKKIIVNPKKIEKINYIGLENIEKNLLNINSISSSEELKSSKFAFKKGDILFGKLRPYLRKIYLSKIDGVCSTDIWVINLKKNCNFSKEFLFYLIADKKFIQYANQSSKGTSLPRADWKYVQNYKIQNFTSIEKDKISKFLKIFDDEIELILNQNNTLEKISTNLFEKLFSNSFYENKNINKWSKGNLSDLIIRVKDKLKDKKLRVLTAINIGELVYSDEYFNKQVYSKNISNYIKVSKFDFAYNPSRINIGSIGINKKEEDGAVSPAYIVFKTKKKWHWFIEKFIKSEFSKKRIRQLCSGSVRQSLAFEDLCRIDLLIPPLEILENYNFFYEEVFNKMKINHKKIKLLIEIRDQLISNFFSKNIKANVIKDS